MKIVNIELNEFYHKKNRKVKYTTYIARVKRGWSKEDAVKEKLPFTRRTKLKKTQEGRVCSKCGEFKHWNEFSKDSNNPSNNYRTVNCKECRNKYKKEYRKNSDKDKEYKRRIRATEYGRQQDKSYIYFKKVYGDSLKKLKELGEVRTQKDVSELKKNVLIRDGKEKEFNLLFD